MLPTNLTRGGTQAKSLAEMACYAFMGGGLRKESVSLAAVNFLFSITAFLGNFLILVALHRESSLHPPSKLLYRCLATTDLLVGLVSQPLDAIFWMSMAHEQWSLCRYAFGARFLTSYALCGVSLLTMTAISVERLLALLLGPRYRQIVTLKRTYIIVATICIVTSVAALCYTLDYRIVLRCGYIVVPSCLIISVASYTKIFWGLRQHQVHSQQHPSQPNSRNMARYKKAVYSALWVQLALVVCYAPYFIMAIVFARSKTYSPHLVATRGAIGVLIYFNSALNPFLYCWKISEVRQAMKQTIREALCCPWF